MSLKFTSTWAKTPVASAVGLLSLLGSLMPAHAQEGEKAKEANKPESAQLERVSVTINKRAELVENVAASVSVMGSRFIERNNIKDFEDVVDFSPSIALTPAPGSGTSSINMRGIGTIQYGMGTSPDVAIVVNDIPVVLQTGAFQDLADVEKVEILKGPQSTLFGRNAIAGAVVITSKRAAGKLGGSASTLITSDGERRVKAGYGGSINDEFAFRVAASVTDFPGNVNNLTTGQKVNGKGAKTFMSRFLWSPTQDFDIELSPRYNRSFGTSTVAFNGIAPDPSKFNATTGVQPSIGTVMYNSSSLPGLPAAVPNQSNQPVSLLGDPSVPGSALYGINVGPRNVDIRKDYLPPNTTETKGIGLRINRRADNGASLSYIAGVESSLSWDYMDQDGFDVPVTQYMKTASGKVYGINEGLTQRGFYDSKSVTQELRFTSSDEGDVRFVGGLWHSYFNTHRHFWRGNALLSQTSPVEMDVQNPTTNLAVFGNANWDISPKFTLEGGLRINKEISGYSYQRAAGPADVFAPTVFVESQNNAETAVTGKLSVRYQIDKNMSAYLLHSIGYKGLAYDITSGLTAAFKDPVASQHAKNYELGLKGNFLQNTLSVNFAAFNSIFTNWQQRGSLYDEESMTLSSTKLMSIPKVTSRGIELDMAAVVAQRLRLNFGIALMKAEYGHYLSSSCYNDTSNVQQVAATYYAKADGTPSTVIKTPAMGADGSVVGKNVECKPYPGKATGPLGDTVAAYNSGLAFQDLDGRALLNAPKIKFNIGGQYDIDTGSLPFKAFLTASLRYTSERQTALNQDPRFIKPVEKIVNVGVGFSDQQDKYKLNLFVNNLFDKQYTNYLLYNNSSGVINNALVTQWNPARDAFRYYGARFDMKF
ncbi:TonB-dependent receptor [Roseateles sp.]|uniref:TonB-dependent receptor n=1 Tax=Roseateles sp. TaxID=1971397 RepID=UPI003BA56938